MRFLFLTTTRKDMVKMWCCEETSPVGSLMPPVDLASVAAVVRQRGHEARIEDLRLFRDPLGRYRAVLSTYRPDAVVINMFTPTAYEDYQLLSMAPDGAIKICYGPHAAGVPEECLERGVDRVLLGDPEAGIAKLLDNGMQADVIHGVLAPGMVNGRQPLFLEDLDSLPFAALDLLQLRRYHAPYIKHRPFTVLLTSRGCPFSCSYCTNPMFFGSRVRFRSAENVADEMSEDMRRHAIREFYFLDSTFNARKDRVEEFCEVLLARDLKATWSCNCRVAPISPAMLKLMKEAGCTRVFYGVEDQDLLDETNKGTTKEQTIQAFRMTKEAGISVIAFTMLFPRTDIDAREYERRMLRVLHELKADAFQCNVAIPFPGTDMYETMKASGELCDDWKRYDMGGGTLPYRSELDLVRLKRNLYAKFVLTSPRAFGAVLGQVGVKGLWLLGKSYLKMSWRSKRRHC